MTTTVLLVRHGETSLNVGHRFRGRSDPPLTERGNTQARAAQARLDLRSADIVYSSPRLRARTTAATLLRNGRRLTVDDGLDDLDYGSWTGKTRVEVAATDDLRYRTWMTKPDEVTFPGGEDVRAVVQRAHASLERYVDEHRGQIVVAVTHDVIVRLLVCGLLEAPLASMHRLEIGLTSVTTLDWMGTFFIIRGVSDTGHLVVV